MKRIMHAVVMILIVLPLLTGCGGSGGANSPSSPPPEIKLPEPVFPILAVTGVAAAGTPLAGTVILKDSSSATKQLSTSPAKDGSYSFNISGLTPPFLLQATGTSGGNNHTFYSLAATGGNCNINPLTNLAVTMANGGQDPAGIFVAPTPAKITAIAYKVPAAVASIQNNLAPMFDQVGASPVNVMTDQMVANHQGVDLLFDMLSITVGNGSVSMVNKADGGTILPSTSIAGGVLSGSPNISLMSSVFTITGHSAGGNVTAQSKAPPYPATPVMTASTGTQGDYRFLVPQGTYEVCGYGSASFNCLNVMVNNGNVMAPDFPPVTQVPFQTVEKASVSPSQVTAGIHVLRSTAAWSNFWSTLKASFVQQPPLPAVNFEENTIIAVVDTGRSTGGYGITITDVRRSPTGVAVQADHSSPAPDCGVTQAFEQPYQIVTLPVFSGEATLNIRETAGACSKAEAEQLSIELTGALRAPQLVYERVARELNAIRAAYPETANIRAKPSYSLQELLIGFDGPGRTAVKEETYGAWKALNDKYGVTEIDMQLLDSIGVVVLTFTGRYNIPLLVPEYAGLSNVKYVEPNGIVGDGDDVCLSVAGGDHFFIFDAGSGDCPSGCLQHTYRGFVAHEDGGITALGTWDGGSGNAPPQWFMDLSACQTWL